MKCEIPVDRIAVTSYSSSATTFIQSLQNLLVFLRNYKKKEDELARLFCGYYLCRNYLSKYINFAGLGKYLISRK